jgi:hypothetical protein
MPKTESTTIFLPNQLPESSSHSEHEVFQALRDTLSTGWTVFSALHWTHKNSKGKFHDGEADFVLYHPDHALLVLEVKGGGIEFNPQTGKWFTIPEGQPPKPLKQSPLRQARSNLYAILKILRRHTGKHLPLSWGYGAVFPNITDLGPLAGKHPQAPTGILACATDLPYLGEWCEQLAQSWIKKGRDDFQDFGGSPGLFVSEPGQPAQSIATFLRAALCPEVKLPTELCLNQSIERERREFLELSKAQAQVLRPLRANQRLAVRGGAGTGKTLLAIQKAISLGRQGIPTLLTCYNRVLAQSMLAAVKRGLHATGDGWVLEDGFLQVQTLPDHLADLLDGPGAATADHDSSYWIDLPNRFLRWRETHDLSAAQSTLAIILDEGQDFGADWFQALPNLLTDPADDFLWVFFDDAQAIYADGLGPDPQSLLPGAAVIDLDENYRNTQEIFYAYQPYCGDLQQRALGPTGRPVTEVQCAPGESTLEAVGRIVTQLVNGGKIPIEQITILTPTRSSSELFVPKIAGFSNQPSGQIQPGKLVIETIHSFKGQESPIVILAEMHHADPTQADRLRYIAMSRALHELVIVEN